MDEIKDEWLKRIRKVYDAIKRLPQSLETVEWGLLQGDFDHLNSTAEGRLQLKRLPEEDPSWNSVWAKWHHTNQFYNTERELETALKELLDFEEKNRLPKRITFTSPKDAPYRIIKLRTSEACLDWINSNLIDWGYPSYNHMMETKTQPPPNVRRAVGGGIWTDTLTRRLETEITAELGPQYLQLEKDVEAICKAWEGERKNGWGIDGERKAIYYNGVGPIKLSKVGYKSSLLYKLFLCLYTQGKKDRKCWVKSKTLEKSWDKKPGYRTFLSDAISELRTTLRRKFREDYGLEIHGDIIEPNNKRKATAYRLL